MILPTSKNLALVACLSILPACDALRVVAPQTVAGFETGGVLGALDGASGAILSRCRTYDGLVVRVAVDHLAIATGTGSLVDRVRGARQQACRIAGAVNTIADLPALPEDAQNAAPF